MITMLINITLLQQIAYLLMYFYRSTTLLFRVIQSYCITTITLLLGNIKTTLLYGSIKIMLLGVSIKITLLHRIITITLLCERIIIKLLCGSITIKLLCAIIKSLWNQMHLYSIIPLMLIIKYLFKLGRLTNIHP